MIRKTPLTQQKISEKLLILSDRSKGMLTRLYNTKKSCLDAKLRPPVLSDKNIEPVLKILLRKFPIIDSKANASFSSITSIKQEILKSLSPYYFTFIDVLDLRDNIIELLTILDTLQIDLNIAINYDLTYLYLELVADYVSLMMLLSTIVDKKAILSLYNLAHECINGHIDPIFPRLGQVLVDYEAPLKKLCQDFVPHTTVLFKAVLSLKDIYIKRNMNCDDLCKNNLSLSLLANAKDLTTPSHSEALQCQYISFERVERWIFISLLLCHPTLQANADALRLWKSTLQNNLVITLFRDETLTLHSTILSFFDSIKGYNKRVIEVKETQSFALQNAANVAREKRKYLRSLLSEYSLVFSDEPGILAPQAVTFFITLTLARDEVLWFIRHYFYYFSLMNKKTQGFPEEVLDRYLSELLFYIEELRTLALKYKQVFEKYYIRYLCSYDAIELCHLAHNIKSSNEEESVMITSFCDFLSSLNAQQFDSNDLNDFKGFRMDWIRLQAYACTPKSFLLHQNTSLTHSLNSIVFHTKMVDSLEEMISDACDLSIFYFYPSVFDQNFKMCLEYPPQMKFSIVYPVLCSHFLHCHHELCPEEKQSVGEKSLSLANMFLEEIANEIKVILQYVCEDYCAMNEMTLPQNSFAFLNTHASSLSSSNKEKAKKLQKNYLQSLSSNTATPINKPGTESYRKTREVLSTLDVQYTALCELSTALSYTEKIVIYDHTFAPKEFLVQILEHYFSKAIVSMATPNSTRLEIARPSEVLCRIQSLSDLLFHTIDNFVHIDSSRIFKSTLLQQTQSIDQFGEKTLTSSYSKWYIEVFLQKIITDFQIYSNIHRAFVKQGDEFDYLIVDEYSDIVELRSLAQLIGSNGMRSISQGIMHYVACQVLDLKNFVTPNQVILTSIKRNMDDANKVLELCKKLTDREGIMQKVIAIGIALSFNQLCLQALRDVLSESVPFLLGSASAFLNSTSSCEDFLALNQLSLGFGFEVDVNPILRQYLIQNANVCSDDEYECYALLMILIALSFSTLAKVETQTYIPKIDGFLDNSHCISKAVSMLIPTIFSLFNKDVVKKHFKEFIALSSVATLFSLDVESEKDLIKPKTPLFIILKKIIKDSSFITNESLEKYYCNALMRESYKEYFEKTLNPF